MALQTGQITVLKNNTVTNVEHQIRFIFTKNSGERITRDTTSKGVINFDIPSGDWNVSWFAVDGDQKVLPLRAGLQLKITSSTPPTALADWIYGDNTHVADPILTQWTEVLDEMKAVRDEFRKDTSFVGSMSEPILRRGYRGLGGRSEIATLAYIFGSPDTGSYYILDRDPNFLSLTPENRSTAYVTVETHASSNNFVKLTWSYPTGSKKTYEIRKEDGVWQKSIEIFNTNNVTPDKNGVLHTGAGTPKDTLVVGDYGIGGIGERINSLSQVGLQGGIYNLQNASELPSGSHHTIMVGGYASDRMNALVLRAASNEAHIYDSANKRFANILTSVNTVVDSNGNYKPASPVIQLHHNRVEYNEDFDKDNPPRFEHVETGVYRITNVREICKDGWTFNKPINGKGQPFFMLKYEQEDETTLIVRVFERTFNADTGEFGFGEPRDIGEDERWIDFHFEVDHERIAREEAQMQKEQEEYEEQERLRKEAEEKAEKEAQEAWEAEIARQEAEMLAEE